MQREFKRGDLKNTTRIIEMMTRTAAGTWLIIALAVAVATTEATTRHTVGGSGTGWTIPTSTSVYSQWASSQKFAVGDTLLFNFTTGQHNVVEVPKASYDSCSTKNQIGSTMTTGPATLTITTPGNYYYICGVTGHCTNGQKLAISVPASSSSAPATAPTAGGPAAPVAPSSSRGTAPAASPSGIGQVPTVSPGPSGGGSSPSSATSLTLSSSAFAGLLSATAAFLL